MFTCFQRKSKFDHFDVSAMKKNNVKQPSNVKKKKIESWCNSKVVVKGHKFKRWKQPLVIFFYWFLKYIYKYSRVELWLDALVHPFHIYDTFQLNSNNVL